MANGFSRSEKSFSRSKVRGILGTGKDACFRLPHQGRLKFIPGKQISAVFWCLLPIVQAVFFIKINVAYLGKENILKYIYPVS